MGVEKCGVRRNWKSDRLSEQECPLKNVSRCIVFRSFHDVVAVLRCSIRIEGRVPLCATIAQEEDGARRGNKANRAKKTQSYLGVKRKKNNRSPISHSVPENVPEDTRGHKEFLRREPSVKEKITTPTQEMKSRYRLILKNWKCLRQLRWKRSRYCSPVISQLFGDRELSQKHYFRMKNVEHFKLSVQRESRYHDRI